MSIAGQSIAVVHSPMHFGASAAHLPSALQRNATSETGQSMSVQGLQGSPHSRPSQGSTPPQPGQPLEQRPLTHSAFGHDTVPSEHIWHGPMGMGQSPSDMHIDPQVGYVEMQRPI